MTQEQLTMRDLLARWAAVEPGKCKAEIRPNEEAFYIAAEAGNEGEAGYSRGWQRVLDTRGGYYPWKSQAFMEIQWAVQQAIVERGWPLELEWDEDGWYAWVNDGRKESASTSAAAEALLDAYLHTLEGENELTNKKAG